MLIGTVLIMPTSARVRYATTSWVKRYFPRHSWVKKYFYTRSQSDSRYFTWQESYARYHTKTYINDNHYTKTAADSSFVDSSGDTMTGNLITSGNITANNLLFSTPRTQYLMLSGANFQPITGNAMALTINRGYAYSVGPGPNETLIAGLNLPNNVTITDMTFFYYDADAGENTDIELKREKVNNSSNAEVLAQVASSGSSGLGSTTASSINSVVDNTQYQYFLLLNNTGFTGVYKAIKGLRITYTVASL